MSDEFNRLKALPICRTPGCISRVYKGMEYCLACRGAVLLDIVCPRCGLTRQLTAANVRKRKITRQTSICKSCAATPEPTPQSGRKAKPGMMVNGCTLIPAKEGRCGSYFSCPNGFYSGLLGTPKDQDCCLLVGRNPAWLGWRCGDGSKPGKLTDEQREAIFSAQRDAVGEIGFFQQMQES